MMTCKEVAALGSDTIDNRDGSVDAALAERLDAHVAGCADCRAFLEQLRSTRAALRMAAPQLKANDRRVAMAAFEQWNAAGRPSARRGRWAHPAYLPTVVGLVVVASLAVTWKKLQADSMVSGAFLAVLAVVIAATVRRSLALALFLLGVGSAVVAVGHPMGALHADYGMRCAIFEALWALVGLGAVAAPSWRAPSPTRYGVAAGAAALGASAATHLSCPVAHVAAHHLVFHSGAVLVMALVGAGVGMALARRLGVSQS